MHSISSCLNVSISEGYNPTLVLWSAAVFGEIFQRVRDMVSKFRIFTVLAALVLGVSRGHETQCPNFATYSQSPHGNASEGPLRLPFMRPPPECRTFTSPAVEVGSNTQCGVPGSVKPPRCVESDHRHESTS